MAGGSEGPRATRRAAPGGCFGQRSARHVTEATRLLHAPMCAASSCRCRARVKECEGPPLPLLQQPRGSAQPRPPMCAASSCRCRARVLCVRCVLPPIATQPPRGPWLLMRRRRLSPTTRPPTRQIPLQPARPACRAGTRASVGSIPPASRPAPACCAVCCLRRNPRSRDEDAGQAESRQRLHGWRAPGSAGPLARAIRTPGLPDRAPRAVLRVRCVSAARVRSGISVLPRRRRALP